MSQQAATVYSIKELFTHAILISKPLQNISMNTITRRFSIISSLLLSSSIFTLTNLVITHILLGSSFHDTKVVSLLFRLSPSLALHSTTYFCSFLTAKQTLEMKHLVLTPRFPSMSPTRTILSLRGLSSSPKLLF